MSRQNKVNPGMYTQRGRLTQDDVARELKRQRSIGSEHTWQPSKKDHFPRLASNNRDAETSGDNDTENTTATAVNAKPASRVTRASATSKAKQSKSADSRTAKKTAGKAKTAKPAAKRPPKRAAAKTTRKAVLARNAGGLRLRSGQPRAESRGGGGSKPRTIAKR